MRNSRLVRSLAVMALASLVLGAFVAAPAEAKKKKKCAALAVGENGAEQPINVVTDAHTAEAPLEIPLETEAGLGAGRDPGGFGAHVSHVYVNIQVDSKASSAPLNTGLEFGTVYDYDLYLDTTDGTEVANSAGYGPVDDGSTEDSRHDFGSELIYGIETADCDGYTLDVVTATSPGGEVLLKLWLGEAPE